MARREMVLLHDAKQKISEKQLKIAVNWRNKKK